MHQTFCLIVILFHLWCNKHFILLFFNPLFIFNPHWHTKYNDWVFFGIFLKWEIFPLINYSPTFTKSLHSSNIHMENSVALIDLTILLSSCGNALLCLAILMHLLSISYALVLCWNNKKHKYHKFYYKFPFSFFHKATATRKLDFNAFLL